MGSTNPEFAALFARVKELEALVTNHDKNLAEFERASIDFSMVVCASLVFFIQLGFMLYEAGSVRLKNTKNIFIKNTLDCCIGAFGYWALGYGLAFGRRGSEDPGNGFCGNSWFFYSYGPGTNDYAHFFYNFTFVAASTTIVSGALAERVTMHAYLFYSLILSSFVYPIISHWVWSSTGWLSPLKEGAKIFGVGAIDFAGSGVVHLTGGVAAFVGVKFIGPRLGRFSNPHTVNPFKPHSANLQVLGTFIQWVGWYGFNCGTILTFGFSGYGNTAGRIAITTTLAGAAAGIVSLYYHYYYTGRYDIVSLLNGIVAGLVSITAGCATVTPWASVIIGVVSAIIYQRAQVLTLKLQLDDAVDAIAVHFWCGIWGVLSVGIFSRGDEVQEVYGVFEGGLIYGGGKIFAANLVLIFMVIAWVGTWMCLFFGIFSYFDLFRVSKQAEIDGLDSYYHGGSAFIYSQDDDPASTNMSEKFTRSLINNQVNPLTLNAELEMKSLSEPQKSTASIMKSFDKDWGKTRTRNTTMHDVKEFISKIPNRDNIPPSEDSVGTPVDPVNEQVQVFSPSISATKTSEPLPDTETSSGK